jgi:hypothetical protein
MWCVGKITAVYRNRMYDLLDLYAEPYDPKKPVICTDEKSKQLLENKKDPIVMRPGRDERYDYEYKRNGTRNIFVAVEPKAGWRKAVVTRRRKKPDFARFIRDLLKKRRYRNVDAIRLVLDNLNTHFAASFYETFPREEAERILSKIEFHYTPTHASWLNMAEIELNVMDRECLGGRRMPDEAALTRELAAWQKRRNKAKRTIEWKFTPQDADKKLGKHYVP